MLKDIQFSMSTFEEINFIPSIGSPRKWNFYAFFGKFFKIFLIDSNLLEIVD